MVCAVERPVEFLLRGGRADRDTVRSRGPRTSVCPRSLLRAALSLLFFHRFPFDEHAVRTYFEALRRELALYARKGFRFSSVYIGGGTPTVMADELMRTLDLLTDLFSPAEISVETNPDRLDRSMLTSLAGQG
jgi:hypothetical protein